MAAQALYRKWRPSTFDEVVGQDHVVRTLRNALISGRIHHAYLFAGPRGTGKTTTARLLAKAVNCLAPEDQRPCNQCAICQAVNEGRLLDLIEIDAASNTGVDDVRELRERVGFRPGEARYKVYVIDEVHMLSTSAFNALLKTLEEPPPHAIFVLATTESHKIPATVLSRCQRFDFRRIPVGEIVARLSALAGREGIQADAEALLLIARQATGSMRDAESLLDQLAAYNGGQVNADGVRAALGTGAGETVLQLVDALADGDVAQGLSVINQALDQGADVRQFARQIVDHLRTLLLMRLESGVEMFGFAEDLRPRVEAQAGRFPVGRLARLIRLFNQAALEARGGWQPQLPLELAVVEAVDPADAPGGTSTAPAAAPGRARSVVQNPRERQAGTAAGEASGTVSATQAQRPALSDGPGSRRTEQPAIAIREEGDAYRATASRVGASTRDASVSGVPGTDRSDGDVPNCLPLTVESLKSQWDDLLRALRERNLSLEALMRSCEPVGVDGDVIVLGFAYGLHRGKVETNENKQMVEDALSDLAGRRCRAQCVLLNDVNGTEPATRSAAQSEAPGGADLSIQELMERDPLVRTAVEDLGARVVTSRQQ